MLGDQIVANISLKFVSRQGFDSGHCTLPPTPAHSTTYPRSSLVLLFSVVETVFMNPVLERCVCVSHTRFQVKVCDRTLKALREKCVG